MDATRSAAPPAQVAQGALRRLAQARLEPTPDNYARAYAEEAGQPAAAIPDAKAELRAQGGAWAALVERLVRNLERGGKQWTAARRKDSLRRVLDGSRSDPQRVLQRLQSLMGAWESDQPTDAAATGFDEGLPDAEPAAAEPPPASRSADPAQPWAPLVATLHGTVRAGLPPDEPRAGALAERLAELADAVAADGATPEHVAAIEGVCRQAARLFAHRHHLVDELGALCGELSDGLTELAEDDSWARGQCQSLQARLADGITVRSVRAAGALLAETRQHQARVRSQRLAARDALRQLIHDMLQQVSDLGEQTGRFQLATAAHAQAIEGADSLEGLAGVVKAMIEDTRAVQTAIGRSHERLQADRARAEGLEAKVRELESELRRLSEEVSTDALTQVANRRGLNRAFELEAARCEREAAQGSASGLAVGLIDIDNFKKLNDSLGHAAGDTALKALAAGVRERLRPVDHIARFGGEEFVILLPGIAIDAAQQTLTRLQRGLSEALFLHDGREVFVTFSAGVTAWRPGEALPVALERADEALYEAKRTGKNRTCIA